jgi:uncharacterized membrane protein
MSEIDSMSHRSVPVFLQLLDLNLLLKLLLALLLSLLSTVWIAAIILQEWPADNFDKLKDVSHVCPPPQ